MTSYADYCPIAVGVDVLGDRWTPLVIRELTVGATGFNEIHRGIPRVSRTLLAQRLRQLERRGLVSREAGPRGRSGRYALTPSGQALTPIVWAMGTGPPSGCSATRPTRTATGSRSSGARIRAPSRPDFRRFAPWCMWFSPEREAPRGG